MEKQEDLVVSPDVSAVGKLLNVRNQQRRANRSALITQMERTLKTGARAGKKE